MGRKTDLIQNKAVGEINLTPLMDLTFILLITFIITFPLLEQGLPVDLPTAKGDMLGDGETATVSVDEEGGWFLDGTRMEKDQFVAELKFRKTDKPETVFLLRADRQLPYEKVIEVMHVLKKEGVQKLNLVTQSGEPIGGA